MEVIDYFRLKSSEAQKIKDEVLASVSRWKPEAESINISRTEQLQMAGAFNV